MKGEKGRMLKSRGRAVLVPVDEGHEGTAHLDPGGHVRDYSQINQSAVTPHHIVH